MDSEHLVSIAADEFLEAARKEGMMALAVFSADGKVIRFKGPPLTHAQIAETLRNMAELFERSADTSTAMYVAGPEGMH